MKKEIIQTIVGIGAIVSMAFGANAYFATQHDLTFVASSQQLHLLSHAIQEVQSQIWQIEGKYKTTDCFKYSPQDRQRYQQLQEKLRQLQQQQSILIQRTTKGG